MISQFAIRLICGLSVVWCLMPRSQVTSGFFRIQMLVTLGLAVLAAVSVGEIPIAIGGSPILTPASLRATAIAIAILSFMGSVMWTLERRVAGSRFAYAIAAVSVVSTVLLCVSFAGLATAAGHLYWLSELATALVSGTAVGGMLLGHWYLTAPTMSTSPLNRVNDWLGVIAGLRLVLSSVALLLYWSVIDGSAEQQLKFTSTHSVWLSLLWIGGIVGPIAVCVMVRRILKYGNTQSATGVLFVGVILAFIGEMSGALLRRELHLPF